MNYQEIKNQQPVLKECFFAFSTEQYQEGITKHNLEGKKIYRGFGGLYGTKEGIEELMNFYDKISDQIGKECDPQEVYNYEFDNHECSISCDDTEPMKLVLSYFTEEQCKNIKRKYGYSSMDELSEEMIKEFI
jgi:hypothetical protein